jgi:hypothetical protein
MKWQYWLIIFVCLSGIMIIGLKTGGKIMNSQILEQETREGIISMAGEEEIKDIESIKGVSQTFLESKSINSEDFNVYYNSSVNGLQIRNKDTLEKNSIQTTDLIFSYEKTDTSKLSSILTSTNIPLERLSNKSFKYNISIPDISKTANDIKYLTINVNSKLFIENDSKSISLYGKDYAIILDFSDIKGFNYTIEKNIIKINIQGITNINIDPTITFTKERVESVSVTPLSKNTMVVAWCDEVSNDVTFLVYYTNGTNLTAPIDVDTSVDSCDYTGVSVSAFNSTSFVIGYHSSDDSFSFARYSSEGTLEVSPVVVDSDASGDQGITAYAVSVSTFNSTAFVIGWHDSGGESPRGIRFGTYWSNGTAISSNNLVEDYVYYSHAVSVSAFNSTSFVIGWHNWNEGNIHMREYTSNGKAMTGIIDVDTNAGDGAYAVSVSALNSTAFVIGWFDDTDDDATFSTYWSNGTIIAGPIDADTTQGTGKSVSVSAQNSSQFVIGWFDQPNADASFSIYNSAGTNLVSQTDSSTTALNYQTVASYSASTGIGFCNQNFVHAYAVSTSVANFTSYYSNGSAWDGNCPDETPPSTCYSTVGKTLYVPNGCTYYIPSGTTGYT